MKTFGIVIVGCGYMGTAHLEAVCGHERARVIGVVDTDEARAKETAHRFGVRRWHTDYRAFARRRDVDAVIIATYPSTHLEIATLYLAEGKHVLCEKPVAANLQDALAFFRASSSARSKVMIGHILRHNSTYQQVIHMIRNGAIGFPIVMRMSQLKQSENLKGHLALLNDASPIIDCGVHYYDVMRWATGAEVKSVSGIGQRLDPEVPKSMYNYGMANVTLSDGSAGFFEAGWGQTLKTDYDKEFIGPKGRIEIIYQCIRPESQRSQGNLIRHYDFATNTVAEHNVPFAQKPMDIQFNHFVKVMDGEEAPSPSMEDVFAAMQTALLADEAIRNGTTVTVSSYPKLCPIPTAPTIIRHS